MCIMYVPGSGNGLKNLVTQTDLPLQCITKVFTGLPGNCFAPSADQYSRYLSKLNDSLQSNLSCKLLLIYQNT